MRLTANPPNPFALAAALLLLITPSAAMAYLGPGVGLGAIGVALGIVGSVILGIFSILWYPFKRLIRKFRKPPEKRSPAPPTEPDPE